MFFFKNYNPFLAGLRKSLCWLFVFGFLQTSDALQAQDIAETIDFITSRPPHVNIEDVVIYPTAQANTTTLTRK